MARSILLTSLSEAENDLPVRYFSLKNEFGFDYCDALLDAEASIKAMLAKYKIDEIIVIGGDNTYHKGEDLKAFALSHGSTLQSADQAELSTYGLLQTRIAQYADEVAPNRKEDALIPKETQEKLIRFVQDFREGDDGLKGKKFNRLFDEIAQNSQAWERLRSDLPGADPKTVKDSAACEQWMKNYLYSEMKPSLKLDLLSVNEGTCIRLIPEAQMGEGGQWIDSMMSMQDSIAKDDEDIDLYVTLNSNDAADTFIVMSILDILVSMPGKHVHLKKIYTVRGSARSLAGSIRDDTNGFGVTELTHAIRSFLNYGKADMIVNIWEKSGERNESIAGMVYAMRHVDIGLSMCNLAEVEQGILRLRQLFRDEKLWRECGYYGMMFSVIAGSIAEDYGTLLQGDGSIPFIDLVKWAYRHQFYQQTLTMIESRAPEDLVKSGIFYYCNDEKQAEQVTHQFALRRLDLKPHEYYKMDDINHYFIKTCDRAATRGKSGRGEDQQHVYATLRTQSIENSDSSMVQGFTACDSLETLQNLLYAYYHIGDVRNKINHAETSKLNDNRLIVSESDESTALVGMRESIDFFIDSYEKAAAEVKDKKPNVVHITCDQVRLAADHMKYDKPRSN